MNLNARDFISFCAWMALTNQARNSANIIDTSPFEKGAVTVVIGTWEVPIANVTVDGLHNIRIYTPVPDMASHDTVSHDPNMCYDSTCPLADTLSVPHAAHSRK